MKKFFKTIFVLGGTALAGYFGYKAYKQVSGTIKLSKTIKEFLKNVYGEEFDISCASNLRSITVKVGVSQEIYDKYSDIEATVKEYIDDFYPELAKGAVVEVFVKGAEPEKEECCCGDNTDGNCCEDKE